MRLSSTGIVAASWLTRVCFIIITAHRYLLPLISEPSSFEIFYFGGMPSWLISSRSPLTTFGAHYILWYELRPSPLRLTESLAALCACSVSPGPLYSPLKALLSALLSGIWVSDRQKKKNFCDYKNSTTANTKNKNIKRSKHKLLFFLWVFRWSPDSDSPTIPAQWPWPFSRSFP